MTTSIHRGLPASTWNLRNVTGLATTQECNRGESCGINETSSSTHHIWLLYERAPT